MTTYTIDDHGTITSGLTAVKAADILLTDDGHEYEIRHTDDGTQWRLFVSQFSRNSTLGGRPLVGSVIWSSQVFEAHATADIAEQVIRSGNWEKDELQCRTDEQHAEMMAELNADEGI